MLLPVFFLGGMTDPVGKGLGSNWLNNKQSNKIVTHSVSRVLFSLIYLVQRTGISASNK